MHKCQLDKTCPNDYHLCPYYHESEKEKDQKRRPLFLFRYSSEVCEHCFDKKKKRYIIKNCPYGDFCHFIHSKNEYNYHTNNFRKQYKCVRNKGGKCPFIKTCYGIHEESDYNKNSENEGEESEENGENEDEKLLEDEDIMKIKEKVENIVTIGKNFICRQCRFLKPEIVFSKNCEHFLCLACFKHIKNNLKKSKKEKDKKNKDNKDNKDKKDNDDIKDNKNKFICPFCNKEFVKGKIVDCSFS